MKAATIYAYASRGLIESVQATSGRERSYRLSELVKLRNTARGVRNQKDSEPAVWTGPLIKSSITEIRPEGHRYRGQEALAIAKEGKPFELVAEMLWDTDESDKTEWSRVNPYTIPKVIRKIVSADLDFLDLFKLLLISTEMSDPVARKLLSDDVFVAARRLIITMAVMPGLFEQRETYLSSAPYPIASTLLGSLSGSKSSEQTELLNLALVTCADHELNASALASRIAASCDASLHSCVLSALGTFSGSMHGAASRRAEDLVSSSLKFKTASLWLKDYMRHSERVLGFGTDLYAGGDPRAKLLIDSAASMRTKNKSLGRLIELVDCVREELGTEPNLDIGLAAVSYALSLPSGSGTTLFAVSRTAGWIAHAIEQRMYGSVIRPRARYIGKGAASNN